MLILTSTQELTAKDKPTSRWVFSFLTPDFLMTDSTNGAAPVTVEQNQDEHIEDAGQAFADLVNEDDVTASTENTDQDDSDNVNKIERTNTDVTDNQSTEQQHDGDAEHDIWANAPDELRSEFQSLQQQNAQMQSNVKANANRVAALNKKLAQQQQEQQSTAEKLDLSDIQGKGFDEIKEDFPELAEYVSSFTEQALEQYKQMFDQQLQPIKSQYKTLQQQQQAEMMALEQQSFTQVHPDYQEIKKSDDFWNWYDTQSPAVQALRTKNAADNIAMLNLYKANNNIKPNNTQNNLSEYVEKPRTGGGRAVGDIDSLAETDPGKYFEMITKGN